MLNKKNDHSDLKRLVASLGRQKIVKTLSKCQSMNIMRLVFKTNSTYNETNRNLKILENEGVVSTCYCGRLRLIQLNRDNSKTKMLLEVLKLLESQN